MNSGKFRYFDYGKRMNQERYNRDSPPDIDIRNIKDVPIALFVGKQDFIANIYDNRWLHD
jgi:hypothetical protein